MLKKRTFIKVRSGILEPKHRRKIGSAIFLYLYILDRANWDDGIIHEWSDETVAEELEMPVMTVRYQRRKLENELYIQSQQKYQRMEISITKWSNPKERSTPAQEEAEESEDMPDDGGNPLPPSNDGGKHGGKHGGNDGGKHGDQILPPLHIDSDIQINRESELKSGVRFAHASQVIPTEILEFTKIVGHKPRSSQWNIIIPAMQAVKGDNLIQFWEEWTTRGYNPYSLVWLTEWARDGTIPPQKGKQIDLYSEQAQAKRMKKWREELAKEVEDEQ